MSFKICRWSELSTGQIAELGNAMASFYVHPPASYYPTANQVAQRYNPKEQPFHCDLVGRVSSGTTVLEVGCGTAHLCPYIEGKGGTYTGLDYSETLLRDNRQRFPQARFFQIGTPVLEAFDIVASLYTIEHVADPLTYLESLWRYCRPGGLIGIICPEFIDSPGFPLSIFFGRTPRRLRQKLQAGDFMDACRHVVDWKIRAPLWKRRLQSSTPGAFWLNLAPGVLHGAGYSIDADAIHLVRLKDLAWFFRQKNAEIVQTSTEMSDITPDVLEHNCYLLVRKPSTAAKAADQ